ncbi:protein-S-isoprenylcysteine O-methyltransferase Ste14 [Methanofollis sp. W23]|nr:protein-S-isoprenylcysteine O-methyltransferase Ste14 [Methanofollis sp. W23]
MPGGEGVAHKITKSTLSALITLILVLPANIYLIGDGLGAGLQFPLLRYQQTYLGTNLITLVRDFEYVSSGILGGKTALSVLLWIGGTLLLVAAVMYLVCRWYEEYASIKKLLSLLIAGAGIAYLASVVVQYGPLLHGPAGFSIPVGVPMVLGVAWLAYHAEIEEEYLEEEDPDEDDALEETSDESPRPGEDFSSSTSPSEPGQER